MDQRREFVMLAKQEGVNRRKLCQQFGISAQTATSGLSGTMRAIRRLNKALRDALAADEVKKQLGNDGTEITPGTPEDYAAFIDKDEKKWSQLVKASGVERE